MSSKNSLYNVESVKSFNKSVVVPTSKSHANRALIIGAIRGQGFTIRQLPESTDVKTMIACLKNVGLKIEQTGSEFTFQNSFPACEKETSKEIIDLNTGDGGTTNRFLIALLSRGKKTYRFFPTEKMSDRPINDLLEPLKQLEVNINLNLDQPGPWLTIKGPASMIKTSKVKIDCQKSTQFASAMMLAFDQLPLTIDMVNVEASSTYIDLTQEILKQTRSTQSYTLPVDFSSLSYPAAFGAILGKCLITNCVEIDQLQSDSKFTVILKTIGADVELKESGLTITSSPVLKPLDVEIKNYPDLFPTLVFLAAHIEGKSLFSHLEILKHKESDRLSEMLKLLDAFKVQYEYDFQNGVLTIMGKSQPSYPFATVKPARDHRIVMAAYMFMRANNGGELFESDCVEKSFPGFFTQLE